MSQRAGFLVEKGAPIVIKERPIPSPLDTQVLVKLLGTGVNPANVYQRDLGVFVPNYPAVVGLDGAGYVVKLGSKAERFSIGDLIIFNASITGGSDVATFQEYAVAEQDFAAKLPSSITAIEGCTLPCTLATAFVGLFHESGADIKPPFDGPSVAPGSSIVILGGSSSVGQATIQLARIAGFESIVVTSSQAHASFLTTLGATHILDRSTSADAVLKIVPNVQIVYDTICNAETLPLALGILGVQGGVLIRPSPFKVENPPPNIQVKSIVAGSHRTSDIGARFWRSAEKWLEIGELKPNRTLVFEGLEKLDEAVSRVKEGVSGVKVVVHVV